MPEDMLRRPSILRVKDLNLVVEEGEAVLAALRAGEVDALVVQIAGDDRVYTLEGADRAHRALVERMSDGALILGPDGTIQFCNRAFARMLGREALQPCTECFQFLVAEDDRPALESMLAEAEQTPVPREMKLATESGVGVPVRVALSPLEDGVLCAIVTDLTAYRQAETELEARVHARTAELEAANARLHEEIEERRRIEDELRESEERLRLAQEGGGVGIYDADFRTQRVVWTPQLEKIYGMKAPSDFGAARAAWQEHVHPDDRAPLDAEAADWLASGVAQRDWEYRFIRPDGEERWISGRSLAVRDSDGRVTRIIGTNIDITERKRAEDALRESEERYRSLFNSIDEGFCVFELVFDAAGRAVDWVYLEANPAFMRQTGWQDVKGKRVSDLEPNLERCWFDTFARVLASGEACRFTQESPAMGRWYDVYAFRVGTPEQKRVSLLFSDITERKQSEDALRESEERFRLLADNIAQFAWMADATGSLFWYNRRWYEYTGTTPEEMRGWGWQRVHHPEHVERVTEKFRRHLETGEPWEDTFPLRGRDGEYRWFLSRAVPVKDETGRVTRWFGTNTDITEQRAVEEQLRVLNETLDERVQERTQQVMRQQEALQESERRFGAIFNQVFQFMGLLTPEGILLEANDTALNFCGFDREQVLGKPFWDTPWWSRSEAGRERLRDAVARAARGELVRYEVELEGAGGKGCTVDFSLSPFRNRSGEVILLIPEARDITDRLEMEQALRQAERLAAVGQMMTVVSHESRNALQRSQACLDMLARRLKDQPESMKLIEEARRAQSDVQRVHEEVREYAAPFTLDTARYDLGEIWREAWDNLEDIRRPGREASFVERIGVADLSCECDRFRLRQVFRNIFENSISVCEGNVKVEITCAAADMDGKDAVRISIRDNGPGIPEERKDHIFEPFYTTKTKGTGLGMTIVRRIVENHGGRISVGCANAPGLELVILLPRAVTWS